MNDGERGTKDDMASREFIDDYHAVGKIMVSSEHVSTYLLEHQAERLIHWHGYVGGPILI